MAIINSCCFWKSLKKGSIASAVYSFIYFAISTVSISFYLFDERAFLAGSVDKPNGKTFLGSSSFNVIFCMPLLGCSFAGSVASVLAIFGLKKDQREFLVPFIFIMSIDVIVAFVHVFSVVVNGGMKFDPMTAFIFTFDFFIICLNIYCLVCIVSQYQEYKDGRVSSTNHYLINNGIASYKAQPPEKSCITLHQSKNSPMNNGHTNFTLIQETQKNGNAIGNGLKSPFQKRSSKTSNLLKKQVKFTDEFKCSSENSFSLNGGEKISEEESNSNSKSMEHRTEENS